MSGEKAREEAVRELVVARLRSLPDNRGISIGGSDALTKEDMIRHVQSGDAVGAQLVDAEMRYLRALKDGSLYSEYAFADAA